MQNPARAADRDFILASVHELLTETGDDWDRCTHRLRVLGRADTQGLFRAGHHSHPCDPYRPLLHAWAVLQNPYTCQDTATLHGLEEACLRSADLLPAHPAPWVTLLGLRRRLRQPVSEVSRVWEEAVRRDPWHREAHRQMLRYLSPDEGGSKSAALDFVESVRIRMPAGAPAVGLHLAVQTDLYHQALSQQGIHAVLARQLWETHSARRALEVGVALWTDPDFLVHVAAPADLNMLAYALVEARRAKQATEVFRLLEGTVSPWPWRFHGDPVDKFRYWQNLLL
ncbi:hypothetical protein [Streptomyces chartreusis]